MQPKVVSELTHESLSLAEKNNSGALSDDQRALLHEFESLAFQSGQWRHERIESTDAVVDAFTIERDGRQFMAARSEAMIYRGNKLRMVEHYVIGEISDNGIDRAINRRQIARRLCGEVYVKTLPDEEIPDFAYPRSS